MTTGLITQMKVNRCFFLYFYFYTFCLIVNICSSYDRLGLAFQRLHSGVAEGGFLQARCPALYDTNAIKVFCVISKHSALATFVFCLQHLSRDQRDSCRACSCIMTVLHMQLFQFPFPVFILAKWWPHKRLHHFLQTFSMFFFPMLIHQCHGTDAAMITAKKNNKSCHNKFSKK